MSKVFGKFLKILRCAFNVSSSAAPFPGFVLGLCQINNSMNFRAAFINQNGSNFASFFLAVVLVNSTQEIRNLSQVMFMFMIPQISINSNKSVT